MPGYFKNGIKIEYFPAKILVVGWYDANVIDRGGLRRFEFFCRLFVRVFTLGFLHSVY